MFKCCIDLNFIASFLHKLLVDILFSDCSCEIISKILKL